MERDSGTETILTLTHVRAKGEKCMEVLILETKATILVPMRIVDRAKPCLVQEQRAR